MRVVLKISGESLKEEQNISNEALKKILKEITDLKENNELIIIVGGGNFWRGRNSLNIENDTSDYIGMLATCMNALALESFLNNNSLNAKAFSAIDIPSLIEKKEISEIEGYLKDNIIILGGGTGSPGVSTDTTTVEAAINYKADLILMSKNVDGIYDKDPKEEGAKKIDTISHEELLNMSLNQKGDLYVMDLGALKKLIEYKIPLYLYNNNKIESIEEVLTGKKGTKVITD